MAKFLFTGHLIDLKKLTHNMRELRISLAEPLSFEFEAGQFLMLQVPLADGKFKQRAYSLASGAQSKRQITLLVKIIPGGIASSYIETLKVGDDVTFKGPFGKHVFLEPPAEQILMLCTGSGLSQHFSFLETHLSRFPNSNFQLIVGVWNSSEVFWTDRLDALKTQFSHFNYDFVIDSPEENWKGRTGYVIDFFDEFQITKKPTQIYLCGNPNMVKSAKSILEQIQFPIDCIVAEAFN